MLRISLMLSLKFCEHVASPHFNPHSIARICRVRQVFLAKFNRDGRGQVHLPHSDCFQPQWMRAIADIV